LLQKLIIFGKLEYKGYTSINYSHQLSDININMYIAPMMALGVKGITDNKNGKDFTREV